MIEIRHRVTGAVLHTVDVETLVGADLSGFRLREADLREADLRGVKLRWTDLRDADLRGADLRDADLRGTHLGGADLSKADLRGAGAAVVAWGCYGSVVTRTHVHMGCVRVAITDLPADDDEAAQAAIHSGMPAWWASGGGLLVRAAIAAVESEGEGEHE